MGISKLNKKTCNKIRFHINNVAIEKVLVSNKISSGQKSSKYFIDYLYRNNVVKPLQIMLPKAIAYVKNYDAQTKWMYFLIEDGNSLEKYYTLWDKLSTDIKKEFDNEPVYNNKIFKTKLKSYGD